jgi:hypothetical protein
MAKGSSDQAKEGEKTGRHILERRMVKQSRAN